MRPNAHLFHLATQKRVGIMHLGQRIEATAWVSGQWAAREASVCGATCWTVYRYQDIGGALSEMVSGLSRDVAIRIVQDMAATDAEEGTAKLADLQAVLRKYLGGYAL